MATTEELIVTARWQGQQLEDGAKRTEDGMKRVRRATSEANGEIDKMNQVARTARNALAGLGIAFSAKAVLDYAESWTKVTNQLRLVSENVERTRAAVIKTALDTHSSLEGTATLYARLTRATQTLGYTEAQRITLVATINNAMRVSGATATEAAAALIQLSQAFSAGRLAGEEFRSVSEQAPYLLDLLAEALGKTRGEIRQMAIDQELTTEIMAEAWLRMAGKVQGEAAKMKLTVGQALEDLKTKLIEFIGASDDAAGGTSTLAAVIKSLADNLWLVQAALLAVGAAWATGGIAAMMKAIGPLLAAGGAGAGMTAGGIAGVAVLGTALANKAGNDLYAQYGNTPTGAAITGGAFGLQAFRERQIAAEEAAKAGGEWVPVFKEVPKSVYAILEAEKLLHDLRLDAVTTTNDEAAELLRLSDAQRKQTEALRKSLEGKGVEPETRDRLMRELKTYQEFQTGLVKARQEEEAAAKAQTEAEKAAALAKRKAMEAAREMAEFDRVVAQASRDRAQKDADHRRDVATGQEMVARSAEELSQARMTENQRILRQFDLETQLGAKTAMLADDTGKLAVQYAQNRWRTRQLIEAQQDKEDADEKALKKLQEAVQRIGEVTGAVQSILGDLGRWLPGANQLSGIAGSVGGLMAAQKMGSGFGMAAGGVGIVTGIMGLADSMWKSIHDGALRAEQAAVEAAEALREFNAQLLSLAGQAGGGSVLALAQEQLMAPIRAMYEAALTNNQLAGAWGESATEVQRAQRQIDALRVTLSRLTEFDLAANWTPGGMNRPNPAVQRAMAELAGQLGMSFTDYLAAVQELFGTDALSDAAMQMFATADAVEALADSVESLDEAAQRAVRATYDLREMMLRQQAASAFQGSGGNLGAQAGIYRTLYGQIEALSAAERAALGAKTAAPGGVIVTPGGGGTTPGGDGTANGGMTQIEVDAGYFSALLAQIPGQIKAALDLAFADWSALGLSEEQIAKLRSVTDPLAQARDLYDGSFAGIDPLDIPQSAFDAIGKATEALTKVNDRLRALGVDLPAQGADMVNAATALSDALETQLWAAAAESMDWARQRQALAEYMNGSRRGEAMSEALRAELVASVQESMEWTRDRANLATYMAGQRRGEAVSEVIYAGLTQAVDAAMAFGDVDALTQLAEQAQFTGIGSQVASFIGDEIRQMYRDTKTQIEGLLGGSGVTPSAVVELKPSVNVDPAAVEAAIAEALRGIPLQDIVDGAMPIAGVDLAELIRIKSADLSATITTAVNEAFRNRKLKVPSSAVRTG